MAEHNALGKKGEAFAQKYLAQNGYLISDINWRFGKEEIDIIAQKNDLVVFIEVKTRTNNYFGDPENFVSRNKQKRIIKAANAYIMEKNILKEARFDVIALTLVNNKFQLEHIQDAFYPTL